jgi:secreted trypsin-like serine protease
MSPPFTVYLTTRESICSGVLLNETTILTAAHCLYQAKDLKVYAGMTDKTRQWQDQRPLDVASIHLAAGYDNERLVNDLAIIKLRKPLSKRDVSFVVPYYGNVATGTEAVVSGWGVELDGQLTRRVRSLNVRIYDDKSCSAKYGSDYLKSTQLCAGTLEQDFCIGDSGGPLMIGHNQLIGIVSYTGSECSDQRPSVYTKLSAYRSFIENYI